MKNTFFEYDKPPITVMVQAENPCRIKELMDLSFGEGAEAYGMQFEKLRPEYQNKSVYRDLILYAKDKPVYVTNYRNGSNEGKTDEELADEMLQIASCGPQLCDVMGDLFDIQSDELAISADAVKKQTELIKKLHGMGNKVLMSSHVRKFIPASRVLEIALEHQRRGADISKIVTGAADMEEQIENFSISNLLKERLDIPFLFLSGGESRLLRMIGGELGSCMYLCVYEHDSLSTKSQPLLKNIKAVRDNI